MKTKLSSLLFGLALILWPSISHATVVAGPITNGATGHIFYVIAPKDYTNAQAEAHSLGGHLATIRSSFENGWVVTNILTNLSASGGPNLTSLPVWIGLFDPSNNDSSTHAADFIWDSGETTAYRDWNSGEPSDTGGNEYYAAINWHYASGNSSDHGVWNDTPEAGSSGYGGTSDGPYYGLVEFGTGEPALPTSAPGAIYGPINSPINGHNYYVLYPASWSNAQAAAVRLGGNLTTVRSQAEDLWIVTNLLVDSSYYANGTNLSDVPMWIGLYDPLGSGENSAMHASNFVWISGETVTYRNWNTATGEPNNESPGEYYAAINWHFAQGETGDHSTWDDVPETGTHGLGGHTDGPYYGIAEVNTTNLLYLNIAVSNTSAVLTPMPNIANVILQTTPSLNPPISWTPIWTNTNNSSYSTNIDSNPHFYRLKE